MTCQSLVWIISPKKNVVNGVDLVRVTNRSFQMKNHFMMKLDHTSLNLLACSLTRWQTDWSDYLHVLIKDTVSTNSMLSKEGTLPVSLLLALHLLQSTPLSLWERQACSHIEWRNNSEVSCDIPWGANWVDNLSYTTSEQPWRQDCIGT